MIALFHSELSEALEAYRNTGDPLYEWEEDDGKPCGVMYELADCLIRVFDLAGFLRVDIERYMRRKMEYNANRPYRHGGKTL